MPEKQCEQLTNSSLAENPQSLEVYVAHHCPLCDYSYEVTTTIQRMYPTVVVRIIEVNATTVMPEAVFATPTYLLNGKLWSLGNPSQEKIHQTFGDITE